MLLTWYGSYHIYIGDYMPYFQMTNYKIATQLGIVGHHRDFVQVPTLEPTNKTSFFQHTRYENGVPHHQKCGVQVLVLS